VEEEIFAIYVRNDEAVALSFVKELKPSSNPVLEVQVGIIRNFSALRCLLKWVKCNSLKMISVLAKAWL
jgi:hypothetical protein